MINDNHGIVLGLLWEEFVWDVFGIILGNIRFCDEVLAGVLARIWDENFFNWAVTKEMYHIFTRIDRI